MRAAEAPGGDPDLQLIETLRWTPAEGYYLFELHLERLRRSADALGFACDPGRARRMLEARATGFDSAPQRVRLLLRADGRISLSASAFELPGPGAVIRYALSSRQTNSGDALLRHKTTRRALYDAEYAELQRTAGCDEVLFTNERGQITEGSRTNVFARIGSEVLTPPLACGLLDGVLRRHLLQSRRDVREAVLFARDLAAAECVYLGNSVRGLVRAVSVAQDA